MPRTNQIIFFLFASCLLVGLQSGSASAEISAPILKWQNGGCYPTWCHNGYYSPVTVIDLEGDGDMEVILSGYRISILNGIDGSEDLTTPTSNVRSWPGVVVADIDADGDLEIISAHGDGFLRVHDSQLVSEWSVQPTDGELRSLGVADLDADGTLEIVVGATGNSLNTWVYEHDGSIRPGWPQLSGGSGYSYGLYNDTIAIGNLDQDDDAEIVVPADLPYISAYQNDGSEIPAHPMYGTLVWGAVRAFEELALEIQGWGEGNVAEFTLGAAVIQDVDGLGENEVVVTGRMHHSNGPSYPSLFSALFVFSADRSRFVSGAYDWQIIPTDTGAPIYEGYLIIDPLPLNPVVADLDGDGEKEILYSSFDGRVHAFWLDKTEHGAWPYEVYNESEGFFRFASEPVVVDLDADGLAEVIFSSWVEKGTNQWGRLHIVDSQGNMVHEIDFPDPLSFPDWNGGLAAPTLAELDGDPDLEILINTARSGVLAYDLPGTADAHVLWKTGRGNDLHNGAGPIPVCGDGIREAEEECDDGNTISGDGCSSTCQSETPSDIPLPQMGAHRLDDAMPCPFNPSTTISFHLPTAQYTELRIYDASGRLVKQLVAENMPAGEHFVRWDGTNDAGIRVASGVFLYQLRAGSFVETKKMALLK